MEESRSGKRRRDPAEAMEAGRSALEAASDSLWACHPQEQQSEGLEQQGAPGEGSGHQTGSPGAGAAGSGALAEVAPTLYEVLTRLLITDRSIRGSCGGQ